MGSAGGPDPWRTEVPRDVEDQIRLIHVVGFRHHPD